MAKKKGTGVVSMKDVEEQMKAFASAAKARLNQPAGNTIGIRNSKFTYKQEVIGRALSVIAIDFVHVNAWYDSDFDPDAPAPPACFAIGADGTEMEPFAMSPVQQNPTCDGCPQNAWASAEQGRGKACKNQYRVACLEPGEDPLDSEIAMLTLPPTSLRNWDKYVRDLSQVEMPTFGVITHFTFEDDAEWPVLKMKPEQKPVEPAIVQNILKRMDDVRAQLNEPFDVSGYEPPKGKRKAKPKTKAAAKAKTKKKAGGGRSSKYS